MRKIFTQLRYRLPILHKKWKWLTGGQMKKFWGLINYRSLKLLPNLLGLIMWGVILTLVVDYSLQTANLHLSSNSWEVGIITITTFKRQPQAIHMTTITTSLLPLHHQIISSRRMQIFTNFWMSQLPKAGEWSTPNLISILRLLTSTVNLRLPFIIKVDTTIKIIFRRLALNTQTHLKATTMSTNSLWKEWVSSTLPIAMEAHPLQPKTHNKRINHLNLTPYKLTHFLRRSQLNPLSQTISTTRWWISRKRRLKCH